MLRYRHEDQVTCPYWPADRARGPFSMQDVAVTQHDHGGDVSAVMRGEPHFDRSICRKDFVHCFEEAQGLRRHAEPPSTCELEPGETVDRINPNRAFDRDTGLPSATQVTSDFAVRRFFNRRVWSCEIERPMPEVI